MDGIRITEMKLQNLYVSISAAHRSQCFILPPQSSLYFLLNRTQNCQFSCLFSECATLTAPSFIIQYLKTNQINTSRIARYWHWFSFRSTRNGWRTLLKPCLHRTHCICLQAAISISFNFQSFQFLRNIV